MYVNEITNYVYNSVTGKIVKVEQRFLFDGKGGASGDFLAFLADVNCLPCFLFGAIVYPDKGQPFKISPREVYDLWHNVQRKLRNPLYNIGPHRDRRRHSHGDDWFHCAVDGDFELDEDWTPGYHNVETLKSMLG